MAQLENVLHALQQLQGLGGGEASADDSTALVAHVHRRKAAVVAQAAEVAAPAASATAAPAPSPAVLERRQRGDVQSYKEGDAGEKFARDFRSGMMSVDEVMSQTRARDIQLKGNWMGVRASDDPSKCQFCSFKWDLEAPMVTTPRVPYSSMCSNCDSAGKRMNVRSAAGISSLALEARQPFYRLATEARQRRVQKLAKDGAALRVAQRRELASFHDLVADVGAVHHGVLARCWHLAAWVKLLIFDIGWQ